MLEAISGVVAALLIIILSRVFAKYFPPKLFATAILVAIAFIYVGFSLKNNPVHLIIVEICMALFLYFLALVGYTRNSLLIAIGIILHGVWDILHHKGLALKTDVPVYWPSFCFIIDIIDGLYFLFLFKSENHRDKVVASN